MNDPFRGELEASRARIEKLESDHAAEVAKLRDENDRLRKRLIDVGPSRTKTGRGFFAFAALLLALSLPFGMFLARMVLTPPVQAAAPGASIVELPTDPEVSRGELAIDRQAVARELAAIRIDECGAGIRGHAKITFAPSGFVTFALVDPPLAGTSTGGCIEQHYRAARVPAFNGPPQTFGKSFIVP